MDMEFQIHPGMERSVVANLELKKKATQDPSASATWNPIDGYAQVLPLNHDRRYGSAPQCYDEHSYSSQSASASRESMELWRTPSCDKRFSV